MIVTLVDSRLNGKFFAPTEIMYKRMMFMVLRMFAYLVKSDNTAFNQLPLANLAQQVTFASELLMLKDQLIQINIKECFVLMDNIVLVEL